MPLKKLEKISSSRFLAIWEITESMGELQSHVDFKNDPRSDLTSIKVETKKMEWLAARALTKKTSYELGVDYQGISKNKDGKPYFNRSHHELSITHSYPYVAVIVDNENLVGIDLEQPKEKIKKIAPKFCSQRELDYSNGNIEQLCVLWSAKETLYKIYSKRGLTFNEHLLIDEFTMEPFGTITGNIVLKEWQKTYKLQYTVTNDYVLVYNIN